MLMLCTIIYPFVIVNFMRDCFCYVPLSVRRSMLVFANMLPLTVSRFILRIATIPSGNQKTWIRKINEKTWKGVWIAPQLNSSDDIDNFESNDLVILYVHGGGFSWGYSSMYMKTFQLIINQLFEEHRIRARILSVDYSLSPESCWPKAINESMDAYRYLINDIGARRIILAGDSAGGNLVASMLLTIKNTQESHPAGVALLSPWLDLTPNQTSSMESQKYDFVRWKFLAKYSSYYIPNFNQLDNDSKIAMTHNPLISPFYGEFNRICPIFISYGGIEILRMNIESFVSKLEQEGCEITVLTRENAMHVWFLDSLLASSKEVYEEDCKSFIKWVATTYNKSLK